MAAVDRNTGQPATTINPSFTQTQTTGPQTIRSNTTGTQRTSGVQSNVSASSALNTTPAILAALENFIGQMSDRFTISDEQLEGQFPLAKPDFQPSTGNLTGAQNPSGASQVITYRHPVTGASMSQQEAERYNAEQSAKRQAAQAAGGITRGGTADQRAIADARLLEIERNRTTQGKYTKEAAFADAQNLSGYFQRILAEQQMPGILRAAEGSGASQGTTRALLTQQAVQRVGESAAKVGIDAAVGYGQVNNQLANTLEALTRQDPNSISNQLLQALSIGKGIAQNQVGSQTTSTNQTTQSQQQQIQEQSGQEQVAIRQAGGASGFGAPEILAGGYYSDAYVPSSQAGTGYVLNTTNMQQDPYQDVSFGGGAPVAEQVSYSPDDEYNFFE